MDVSSRPVVKQDEIRKKIIGRLTIMKNSVEMTDI